IVRVDADVFDQPGRMTDPVGAAPLNRLPYALFAERLARMDRDVEVLTLDVVESVDVLLGRKAALLAGEIEADDAALAEVDGELGQLHGQAHVPHRTDDEPPLDAERLPATLQSPEDGVHDLVPVQFLRGMKDRRKTGLDVDDAVFVHVLDHFERDAL